jgi:hypothetical protein
MQDRLTDLPVTGLAQCAICDDTGALRDIEHVNEPDMSRNWQLMAPTLLSCELLNESLSQNRCILPRQ